MPTVATPRRYPATHMYNASDAFARADLSVHLRRRPPAVLPHSRGPPTLLDMDVGLVSGPASLGIPARARKLGLFNPSLAAAPPRLCPRCAWVCALRADPLHQCDANTPLLRPDKGTPKRIAPYAYFKGTVIAVLDTKLRVLGWTWLINAPRQQVSPRANTSRWYVPVGAADNFAPPWRAPVFDVRLVNVADRLFISFTCVRCTFSVAHLQLTAQHTADGGVQQLRAWQTQRFAARAKWAQGRNQALFVASRRPGAPDELMVQPWINLVASFGAPGFRSERPTLCDGKLRTRGECGATPIGTRLQLEGVSRSFGTLGLLSNASRAELSPAAVGGFMISTTSNLVRVARGSGVHRCELLLGVGHVHRSSRWRKRRQIFAWGHHYTHFFYALQPHEPFHPVATSAEFCFQAEQDAADCESVQFVSGLALQPDGETLLASYGVNDCEAKVARLGVDATLHMLEALPGDDTRPCDAFVRATA